MRAVVTPEHGGLEQMVFQPDYRDPVAGPDEVVLSVRACTLNYHDVFTRKGMPGIRVPLPLVLGIDVAGEIVEVGPEVQGFAVGQRVLVDPIERVNGGLLGESFDGGLAERVRVPAHMLVALPDEVDFADAAALPVAYGTAYRMMVTRGRIQPGETVLVLGASGGVGTCCVQLAKQAGATVIACASSDEKLERLKELGADVGINYATTDWVAECRRRFGRARVFGKDEGGIDVVVNFTGGDSWVPSMRSLKRGGRRLTCGATAGYDPKTDIRFIWTFELKILGSNSWTVQDLETLMQMIAEGRLTPAIDRVLPLEQGREAVKILEDRAVLGKVIVKP